MQITPEIDECLHSNPNGDGFIPKDNLPPEKIKLLKELNEEYKKLYEKDLIIFQ